MYLHPRMWVAGAADQRSGGRRRAMPLVAVLLLLGALVGIAPAHAAAASGTGAVVGWGLNDNGRARPPAGLTGVAAIAAGQGYSLALKRDGTVVGWGGNGFGQASSPAGLTGVTEIAVGPYHNLALRGRTG